MRHPCTINNLVFADRSEAPAVDPKMGLDNEKSAFEPSLGSIPERQAAEEPSRSRSSGSEVASRTGYTCSITNEGAGIADPRPGEQSEAPILRRLVVSRTVRLGWPGLAKQAAPVAGPRPRDPPPHHQDHAPGHGIAGRSRTYPGLRYPATPRRSSARTVGPPWPARWIGAIGRPRR